MPSPRPLLVGVLLVAQLLAGPFASAHDRPVPAPPLPPAPTTTGTPAAPPCAGGTSTVGTGVACAAGAILGALLGGVGAIGGCALLAGSFLGAAKAHASANGTAACTAEPVGAAAVRTAASAPADSASAAP